MQITNETEFADQIDCRFPYANRERALELINTANSISPNAMFMVLEELCRPPDGEKVSKKTQVELISVWFDSMKHPLAKFFVRVTQKMVDKVEVPIEDALRLVEEIAPYKGLYAALNIVYFSCHDSEGVVESALQKIHRDWENH